MPAHFTWRLAAFCCFGWSSSIDGKPPPLVTFSLAGIALVAIYLTYVRTAFVAMAICAALFILFGERGTARTRRFMALALTIIAAVVAIRAAHVRFGFRGAVRNSFPAGLAFRRSASYLPTGFERHPRSRRYSDGVRVRLGIPWTLTSLVSGTSRPPQSLCQMDG